MCVYVIQSRVKSSTLLPAQYWGQELGKFRSIIEPDELAFSMLTRESLRLTNISLLNEIG